MESLSQIFNVFAMTEAVDTTTKITEEEHETRRALARQIIEEGLDKWPASVRLASVVVHETYREGETVVNPGDRVFDNDGLYTELGSKVVRRAQPYDALFVGAEEVLAGKDSATRLFVAQLMMANDVYGTLGLALTGSHPRLVARLMLGEDVHVTDHDTDAALRNMEKACVATVVAKTSRQARRKEQRLEKKARRRAPQWDRASGRR